MDKPMVINKVVFKKRRQELNLTQENLESKSGAPQTTICKIERGRRKTVSLKVALGLAKALKLPVTFFQ